MVHVQGALVIVLVCGGRHYGDYDRVRDALDLLHRSRALGGPITQVVHGGAAGADSLAQRWAVDRKLPVQAYAADWARYGRGAGPRRNATMLQQAKPDLVVAFPGGAGTHDMVARARRAGVTVYDLGEANDISNL